MPTKKSKLAPQKLKEIDLIEGISVSITHCGLKKNKKEDLVLVKLDSPGEIVGAFTSSKTPGESIIWNKSIIRFGKVSAILINSGNANVFNGRSGRKSLLKITKELSNRLELPEEQIFIASTGVIGEPLDENKILRKIPYLISNLENKASSWLSAAKAITTTDTFPKTHSEKSSGKDGIIINGIAKGSGMIAPNMATMLAFIFTNVQFQRRMISSKFMEIVDKTFNSITVDGDTSTSDMVLFFSVRNKGKNIGLDKKTKDKIFFSKLERLMTRLAHYIVKDGEGASKFIKIEIKDAKTKKDAKEIGKSIANSPLFKTAMAGSDSNWGRVIMAIGKSHSSVDAEKLTLKFGKFFILKKGKNFSPKDLSNINKYLKEQDILITVDIGLGSYSWCTWTCDFTKDYVKINADYRS
jgi:glutamate N-acetyltransferase/amino-acid N-acetyltransferase